MAELVLYHTPTCPFCSKVRQYLEQHHITVPLKDILETPSFREELIHIGGKSQVPCLVIDGKALYESDDIIQWFRDNAQPAQ